MTNQHRADLALAQWQALRSLAPEERIEALMSDFFAPPLQSDAEYEATLRSVSEEMRHA